MTHDPLCPIQPPVVGSGGTDPAIRTMPESAGVPCQCDLIAKVRADQDRIHLEEMQSLVLVARKAQP